MSRLPHHPVTLDKPAARALWLRAQRLDACEPFGAGPDATPAAVAHLGYVQIDTIAVIERCHHHILWSRIPGYRREHLHQAQKTDKSVFEYWTHALAYVATADLRFFVPAMKQRRRLPRSGGYARVRDADTARVLARIRRRGPLSLRDFSDDEPVDKDHAWASRKPSRRVLQLAFLEGRLAVSERQGMLKTYELMGRHFGWRHLPAAATPGEVMAYRLDRALRTQGVVSLESVCHGDAAGKRTMRPVIEARVRRGELLPAIIRGTGIGEYWLTPEALDTAATRSIEKPPQVHILSPFDPLIIQRPRLQQLFDYQHRFEAYLPASRRVMGYFTLPVLVGDRVVAALDLKADRAARVLQIQQWHWIGHGSASRHGAVIEAALDRFARFQWAQ